MTHSAHYTASTLIAEIAELKAQVERLERELADVGKQCTREECERQYWAAKHSQLEADAARMREAARALLDDVHRRYPGEDLRCPYMRALEAALAAPAQPSRGGCECPDGFHTTIGGLNALCLKCSKPAKRVNEDR